MAGLRIDDLYCINLDRCTERWTRMEKRLAPICNELGRSIESVRFRAQPATEDARVQRLGDGQPEPFSEDLRRIVSISCDHAGIWEQADEDGHQRVLILEDDVFFMRDWVNTTNECLERLDQEHPAWDLFMLNASGWIRSTERGLRKIEPDNGLVLAGAYVLSHRGLRKLVDRYGDVTTLPAELVTEVVDHRLVWLQRAGQSFFYYPYLALQEFWESVGATDQAHVQGLYQWQEHRYRPEFGRLYEWPDPKERTAAEPSLTVGSALGGTVAWGPGP